MVKTQMGQALLPGMTVTYHLVAEYPVKGRSAYGVEVRTSKGESACVRDISVSAGDIRSLLEHLIRNTVTPVTLRDVIEDWLS